MQNCDLKATNDRHDDDVKFAYGITYTIRQLDKPLKLFEDSSRDADHRFSRKYGAGKLISMLYVTHAM
jgi:hypothetical protein